MSPAWAGVAAATDAEVEWLASFLSFEDKEAQKQAAIARAQGWEVHGDGKHHLYQPGRRRFPSGLLKSVQRAAEAAGVRLEVLDDRRPVPPQPRDTSYLRPYQQQALEAAITRGHGVVKAPTGCHGAGTLILMADGARRPVEAVRVGDRLMGPDGTPRTVATLCRGRGAMYEVVPTKGEPFTVNDEHVLTLVRTNDGTGAAGHRIDVTVADYLQRWSATARHVHKLERVGVVAFDVAAGLLPIEPYMLGVLLGDGTLSGAVAVTTADAEIVDQCARFAESFGVRVVREDSHGRRTPTYYFRCAAGAVATRGKNPLGAAIRKLGLWGKTSESKFVPPRYLVSSREDRLQLLAGLLDSDGHLTRGGFDFVTKSPQLADDLLFLARSLGLAANQVVCFKYAQTGPLGEYSRVSISGDLSVVPTKLPRKQAPPRRQRKNVLRTGFCLRPLGEGDFYGFTLEGDPHYLLGDFTVTHNSGKTHVIAALVAAVPCRWIIAAPQVDLLSQTAKRVRQLTGETCGQVGDGEFAPARVTVATLQTLGERLGTAAGKALVRGAEGIIVDECHVLGASSFYRVVMAAEGAARRVGFSATPFARGDGRSAYVMAALGPKVFEIPATELVEAGVLSKPTITMFPLRQYLPPGLGWKEVYRKGVVESEVRNRAVVALARGSEKPCLVFVKEIDHGRVLLRMLQRAGVSTGFVWGDTSTEDRQKAITKLSRGEVDVLVSSTIFEQGVDIQEVRTVVVASGGKSTIRAVQRLGRGMRVADGKRAMQLWDFDDQGQVWLDRHSAERMTAYLKEGHSVSKLDTMSAQLMLRKFQDAA